jgi:chaperonin GroEL (HSP60 family)
MQMINDIRLTSEDAIEVVEVLGKFDLLIDNVVVTMERETALKIHEAFEEALFDVDSWNVNLQKKVDQLEARILIFEEDIEGR